MNVKALALSLAGVLALSANAQEVTGDYVQTTPAKEVAFKTGGKWFMTVKGGLGWMFSNDNNNMAVSTEAFGGWNVGLGLGTWWNPYFGTRLMVEGGSFKNPYALDKDAYYVNPHMDFMFDMSNFWAPYDADRVFHFVPYIGVGAFMGERVFEDDALTEKYKWGGEKAERWNPSISLAGEAGIDLRFNFSRNFALTVGPSVTIANAIEHVSANGYESEDFLAKLNVGLNFGFGEQAFEAVEPMDYDLLNSLQSEINSLRSQNAELSKRPVRCPECPEQVVEAEPTTQSVVYFRIDSSKIDKNQFINIYQVAEFVKANNTAITVTGYADVETGNPDYNMSLSEKRARNVADVLIEEYGVPSDLITIDYKGDTVQPFETNAWNRVVIMKNK